MQALAFLHFLIFPFNISMFKDQFQKTEGLLSEAKCEADDYNHVLDDSLSRELNSIEPRAETALAFANEQAPLSIPSLPIGLCGEGGEPSSLAPCEGGEPSSIAPCNQDVPCTRSQAINRDPEHLPAVSGEIEKESEHDTPFENAALSLCPLEDSLPPISTEAEEVVDMFIPNPNALRVVRLTAATRSVLCGANKIKQAVLMIICPAILHYYFCVCL